ncbi:MAG TPA: winged helix-turn-helix domain-containing protein [Thermomicrobiales bacterium]|nr:winged helix-turn-helix domain-containing protein [Thermomicrobiales bacterium]
MQNQPPLRLYVCGQLAVEYGDTVLREADFPARQSRRLWAYLVLNRRGPVGREELIEALWGEDVPDAWDATLNGLVSRLRRFTRQIPLDPNEFGIRGEVGRYVLRLPGGTFIDHERARSAIHDTETLLRREEHGPASAS